MSEIRFLRAYTLGAAVGLFMIEADEPVDEAYVKNMAHGRSILPE
jgi:hypothetical protein